jgi:hypothetical protein
VVIGGVAAIAHGSAQLTYDLDICYNRSTANLAKLVRAITGTHPTLRNAPPDLPFIFDERSLKNGLNFTFQTDLGELDILGEVGGVGVYEKVVAESKMIELDGMECYVLDINALIRSKKFAGRKKDEPVIFELEAIQEMMERKKK